MRKWLSTLSLVIFGACHRPAVAPMIATARCYEGVAEGFVDSLAAPDAPRRPVRAWLVLAAESSTAMRSRAVFVVATDSTGTSERQPTVGTWNRSADSVDVRTATFPSAEWRFGVTPDGLRGRLHAESDVVQTDVDGVVIHHRADWPAVLTRVPCDVVPGAGRLTWR